MIAFLTGLAAGAAHVVTGPDHLAALAPLALDRPKRAAALGFRWGLGHGTGVVALGGLGVATKTWAADWWQGWFSGGLDVQTVSAVAECLVGGLLIVVGLWSLRAASRLVVHEHPHGHQRARAKHHHRHLHVHVGKTAHDSDKAHRNHNHAAMFVGMLHGAAGTGHVLGVVPSLAMPPAVAIAYLGAYLFGAIFAMTAFGGVVGRISALGGPVAIRRVMYGAAALSMGLGVVWLARSWP